MKKQILIVAYNRPDYTRQVVDAVKLLKDRTGWCITASLDMLPDGTHCESVKAIVGEVADIVVLQSERLDCNKHVRVALTNAHASLSGSDGALLYLEDDIVPAPDCLEFCLLNMQVLRSSDRIKCMTLMGENHGDVHVAWRNRHGFKAHRWFNAWGNFWIASQLGQVLTEWPSAWDDSEAGAWDARLLGKFLDNEWLSVTPLLGRVQNIGEVGRFITGPDEFRRRKRDFWAGSDFSKPIAANFR